MALLADCPSIILYADGFGRFEGCVARLEEGGFSLKLKTFAPQTREKIAEQLTVHLNRGILDDTVVRRHDRAPTRGIARFTRANGDTIHCEVVDLSLSGVALKTDIRPPLGEMVLIGQTAGRVVRHLDGGIALDSSACIAKRRPPSVRSIPSPLSADRF